MRQPVLVLVLRNLKPHGSSPVHFSELLTLYLPALSLPVSQNLLLSTYQLFPCLSCSVKSGEDPSKFLTGDAADDAKPSQDDPVGDRTTSPLMENGGTSGANTAEDHGTTGDVSSTASVLRAFGQGLRSVGSLFTRAQSALRGQRDSGTADVSAV